MLSKIQENISGGRYGAPISKKHVRAWQNSEGGWTDYLLSEKVIFSHRTTHCSKQNFTEYLHAHDFFELVFCVGGGNMQYVADRRHLAVDTGTIGVTSPMSVHMFRPITTTNYDRYVIYFHKDVFPETLPDNLLSFLNTADSSTVYLRFSDSKFMQLLNQAQKIEQCLIEDKEYANTEALLAVAELFLLLSRHTSETEHGENVIPSPAPAFISEIKHYIDDEYTHIRTVTDLTEKFFYSREYITRVFKQYYNTPIYEYILNRKLLYSCTLLSEGMSVEKAAMSAGFNNMSSYIKSFKRFAGSTPSTYRQKKQFRATTDKT